MRLWLPACLWRPRRSCGMIKAARKSRDGKGISPSLGCMGAGKPGRQAVDRAMPRVGARE